MKIIDTIKQRQHRPALVIGLAVLAYLVFFSFPEIFPKLRAFAHYIRWLGDYRFSNVLWSFVELLCILAGLAIWILSIVITWATFRKSRHKAYIFILAYFLLPLVVQPSSLVIKNIMLKRRLQQYERLHASGQLQPVEADTREPLVTFKARNINLPVGPLLLLAGVWYLYKKEERKDDEQHIAP